MGVRAQANQMSSLGTCSARQLIIAATTERLGFYFILFQPRGDSFISNSIL